jgi:hypothetical protein
MSVYSYDPREQVTQDAIRRVGSQPSQPLSYDDRDAWTNVAINGGNVPDNGGMVQDVLENSPGELDAAVAKQDSLNDNFPTDANGDLQFDDGIGASEYPTDAKGELQFDDAVGADSNEGRGTEAAFKVRLVSTIDVSKMVIFEVSPSSVSESNATTYSSLEPVHMPGTYQIFKNTQARKFTVNAKLISRSPEEATSNATYLQRLRAWMRPYFGEGTRRDTPSMLGAPPEVLYLYGYTNQQASTTRKTMAFNYHRIPVVIESLNVSYPDTVDYIPTVSGEPMPIVMTIDISLVETHSPFEFYEFSLAKYHQGLLEYF